MYFFFVPWNVKHKRGRLLQFLCVFLFSFHRVYLDYRTLYCWVSWVVSDNHGSEDVPDKDTSAVWLKIEGWNATKLKDDEKIIHCTRIKKQCPWRVRSSQVYLTKSRHMHASTCVIWFDIFLYILFRCIFIFMLMLFNIVFRSCIFRGFVFKNILTDIFKLFCI